MGMCVLRQREERLTAYIRSLRLAPNGHHLIPTTLNKKDTRNPIKQKFKVPTLGILLSRTQSNKSNWVLSFKKSFTHDMHNPKGIFGFTHDLILPQHNKLTQFFFSIFTHILYRNQDKRCIIRIFKPNIVIGKITTPENKRVNLFCQKK